MTNTRDFALGGAHLTNGYVRGIVDREGCFSLAVLSGTKIAFIEFKVTQKAHSAGILHDLQRFFSELSKSKVGSVVIDNRRDDTLKFKVTSLSTITDVIIPFFDANPLITVKNLNYKAFREIALLMKSGAHLTVQGSEKILTLKQSMNVNRSFIDKYKFLVNNTPVITAE